MREFRGGVENGPCSLQPRFECPLGHLACALSGSKPSLAQGPRRPFDGKPESVWAGGAHTAAAVVGPGGRCRRRELPASVLSTFQQAFASTAQLNKARRVGY